MSSTEEPWVHRTEESLSLNSTAIQLVDQEYQNNENILEFKNVYQSPYIRVRCALWSCTVLEDDGSLVHRGFRTSGLDPVSINGAPPRNIKTLFGDASGILGALTKGGSIHLFTDDVDQSNGWRLRKHRFDTDNFLSRQNLTIDHIAIADNGEVCICTKTASHETIHEDSPTDSPEIPSIEFSPPTARLQIHTFSSIEDFLSSEPPTSTYPILTPLRSLCGSATCFTALTATDEVLTFGSALHPQTLGRAPTPINPAEVPSPISFLGGISIDKIAAGGWMGAAVSEDRDLYVWGGQAGAAKRLNALPKFSDGEEVRLVDINGGVDVVDVGVGSEHIIALTGDGEVWVTGEGDCGQLGTGTTNFEEDWVRVRGDWEANGRVVGVGGGVWCSWVLVDSRTFV